MNSDIAIDGSNYIVQVENLETLFQGVQVLSTSGPFLALLSRIRALPVDRHDRQRKCATSK
jgi:hypothetical protein